MAKVELPLVIEKGLFNVSLNDVCFEGAVRVLFFLFENRLDVFESEAHFDAITSVAVLAGFDDPDVILFATIRLVLLSNLFPTLVIVADELKIFFIFHSFSNVEGQR